MVIESVLLHKQTYHYHWSMEDASAIHGLDREDVTPQLLEALLSGKGTEIIGHAEGGSNCVGFFVCLTPHVMCMSNHLQICIETADISSLVLFYLLGGVQFHMIMHRYKKRII